MKTAVIYARYSSERQTEQSIEGQLRVCNEYAKNNDILVVDTYIDRAMTGTNDNRTDFQRMLRDSCKKAWDIVLVYKLDRFSRNKYEMAMHKKQLKDNGIKLVSAMENIPDTPEGIILESLLEGMAEYYSAELSQKVKRGMNETRQKGNFTGGRLLYGYKKDGSKIVIDEDRAKIVKRIYQEYLAGRFIKDIIKELTDEGIFEKDKSFPKNTVYNILKNNKYSGKYDFRGQIFENIYPQIIPDELFKQVRQKEEENKYGKHTVDVNYILKNKMICGYCGKTIASETGTARDGSIKRYYKCLGKKRGSKCELKPIRKDIIEKLIVDVTYKAFDNMELVYSMADKIIELHNKRNEDESVLILLEKDKNSTQKSIDNLIDCMEKGIVTNSTRKRIEDLENRLNDIDAKILLEQSKTKLQVTKQDIIKFIRTTLKKDAKQIIQILINNIVLYNDRVEIHYNFINYGKRDPDDKHQDFCFYTTKFKTKLKSYLFHKDFIELCYNIEAYI